MFKKKFSFLIIDNTLNLNLWQIMNSIYQNDALLNKRPKIGHLGLLTQMCLKYSVEFDQVIKTAANSSSMSSSIVMPPSSLSSSQSSIKSVNDSQSSTSSIEVKPKKYLETLPKQEIYISKNEKLKIKEELLKKKLKLEKLNKKLERKLELINQNKTNKLNNKSHHHKKEEKHVSKPILAAISPPREPLPPININNNNTYPIFEPNNLFNNPYYQAKIMENLMLLTSSTPTSPSSSSTSPLGVYNYLNTSPLMPPSHYNANSTPNASSTITSSLKTKRFNPYELHSRPSVNKFELPSLTNNHRGYEFVPPIFK